MAGLKVSGHILYSSEIHFHEMTCIYLNLGAKTAYALKA